MKLNERFVLAGVFGLIGLSVTLFYQGCGRDAFTPSESSSPASTSAQTTTSGITYAKNVAPIIMDNCVSCHNSQGGIAPFALETYEQVSAYGSLIKSSMQARVMPPPGVDNSGECQEFDHVRWMSDADIQTVADWVDTGKALGDPNAVPPVVIKPAGLPEPVAAMVMPVAYTPNPAEGEIDDYRCFVVDPKITTTKYITGFEVKPGDTRVVHHVILYKPTSDEAQADFEAKESTDGLPGYPCFGSAGGPADPVALWAPGGGAVMYPEGTGILVEAGRKFVFQVHYNTANGKYPDQSTVLLKLEDSVAKAARWALVADLTLNLPPDTANVEQSAVMTVKSIATIMGVPRNSDLTVYGVGPHMHKLGKQIKLERASNNECLMRVPAFDFNWQGGSLYSKPLTLSTTDSVKITCNFDTTGKTTTTKFGEGTEDEMCLAFLFVSIN